MHQPHDLHVLAALMRSGTSYIWDNPAQRAIEAQKQGAAVAPDLADLCVLPCGT